MLAVCYAGDAGRGRDGDMRRAARASASRSPMSSGRMPFTGWQTAFDPLLTPGARNYWKSHDFTELSDARDRRPRRCRRGGCRGRNARSSSRHVGGAAGRVPPEATAYPAPRRAFRHERAHALARPGEDERLHRLGARVLRRDGAVRDRQRLRQLHDRGRGGAGGGATGRTTRGWPRSSGATIRTTCSASTRTFQPVAQ